MARVIMIQGTMSNAGKSLIAAGLCRIFAQDGYRVAPFKSQNMALNSFITDEGLEMGRAQVMQAEAAGEKPVADMNPILLKPTSDVGSQVIVGGRVRGNMDARTYFGYKKSLTGDILSAYDRLAASHDVIVVEGAGSPAEINLKADDIVNMGLAKMLRAPVLLVGDIDRGGVFAQLAGTMLLLEPEEKRMVRGLVINKFRGDKTLLDPGIKLLKNYTDVPVVGTVPWMQIDLDDEDSLSPRLEWKAKSGAPLHIAVIRLPHISNFTDFNALSRLPGVELDYEDERSLPAGRKPDLIILPGTKNTIHDLRWLKETGLAGRIVDAAHAGVPVLGVCGGFQMLGKIIRDPEGAESGGEEEGLGLLPLTTIFSAQKTRTRTKGSLGRLTGPWAELSGQEYEGYEIHMGESFAEKSTQPLRYFQQDSVLGTYFHGLFDSAAVQKALWRMLRRCRGLATDIPEAENAFIDSSIYKEKQYDRLAQVLRENLDMAAVRRILREGL